MLPLAACLAGTRGAWAHAVQPEKIEQGPFGMRTAQSR
jgi:hypothetical protein